MACRKAHCILYAEARRKSICRHLQTQIFRMGFMKGSGRPTMASDEFSGNDMEKHRTGRSGLLPRHDPHRPSRAQSDLHRGRLGNRGRSGFHDPTPKGPLNPVITDEHARHSGATCRGPERKRAMGHGKIPAHLGIRFCHGGGLLGRGGGIPGGRAAGRGGGVVGIPSVS